VRNYFEETIMSKTSLVFATGIALVVSMAAIQPASANSPASVVVKYGDLDLRSESDARILLARLETAARRACKAELQGVLGSQAIYMSRGCRRDALARGVQSVGAPKLTAAYSARWHQRPTMIARLP